SRTICSRADSPRRAARHRRGSGRCPGQRPREGRPDARAPQEGRLRRLLDQRRDAARARPEGAAAPLAEHINVEFVSANPTGPMHVGHARNAAYGDALARLLAFEGHDVTREFYANDYGTQVRNLGESIRARARGEDVP